jgi:hypothetical protein
VTITTDDARLDQLAGLWRHFAASEAGPYSPLYAAIGRGVAEDRELLALVVETPPETHLPIFLMAAAHHLVLGGIDHELGDVYAGRSTADPFVAFRDLCLSNRAAIGDVLATRRIQTNECGRSALLALALDEVATRCGPIAALVDAGASAGLNLRYDRYHLDYGAAGSLGDPTSAVRIPCELRGRAALPTAAPAIPVRVGLDRNPIDVTDDDDRRWLLACVWPDTGRLERTASALAIAAADPPDVRPGDIVDDITPLVDGVGGTGLVCVVTSWAAGYLSPAQRAGFIDALRDAATRRPVAWLSLEAPGTVDLFERPADPGTFEIEPSVIGLARFDDGQVGGEALALVHPHGKAYEWLV